MLGDDRYALAFLVAGGFAALAAVTVLGVPRRVDRSSAPVAERGKPPLFHRAAFWPGVVLASGIAAFSVFTAFIPEYSRSVGLAGSAGLFLVYSAVSLQLRLFGAKLPERLGEHRMVTVALVARWRARCADRVRGRAVGALGRCRRGSGVGMAFMYPSLMANVVNRVDDGERASALSSFTMFFEIGTIVGGVVLGAVGEIFRSVPASSAVRSSPRSASSRCGRRDRGGRPTDRLRRRRTPLRVNP